MCDSMHVSNFIMTLSLGALSFKCLEAHDSLCFHVVYVWMLMISWAAFAFACSRFKMSRFSGSPQFDNHEARNAKEHILHSISALSLAYPTLETS